METSLLVIYGIALDPQDYAVPLLEKIRKALAQLRGVASTITERATLLQSRVLSILASMLG